MPTITNLNQIFDAVTISNISRSVNDFASVADLGSITFAGGWQARNNPRNDNGVELSFVLGNTSYVVIFPSGNCFTSTNGAQWQIGVERDNFSAVFNAYRTHLANVYEQQSTVNSTGTDALEYRQPALPSHAQQQHWDSDDEDDPVYAERFHASASAAASATSSSSQQQPHWQQHQQFSSAALAPVTHYYGSQANNNNNNNAYLWNSSDNCWHVSQEGMVVSTFSTQAKVYTADYVDNNANNNRNIKKAQARLLTPIRRASENPSDQLYDVARRTRTLLDLASLSQRYSVTKRDPITRMEIKGDDGQPIMYRPEKYAAVQEAITAINQHQWGGSEIAQALDKMAKVVNERIWFGPSPKDFDLPEGKVGFANIVHDAGEFLQSLVDVVRKWLKQDNNQETPPDTPITTPRSRSNPL